MHSPGALGAPVKETWALEGSLLSIRSSFRIRRRSWARSKQAVRLAKLNWFWNSCGLQQFIINVFKKTKLKQLQNNSQLVLSEVTSDFDATAEHMRRFESYRGALRFDDLAIVRFHHRYGPEKAFHLFRQRLVGRMGVVGQKYSCRACNGNLK